MPHTTGHLEAGIWQLPDGSRHHAVIASHAKEEVCLAMTGKVGDGDDPISKADAQRIVLCLSAHDDLVATLRGIAEADPAKWDAEVRDQFREWAQSRARFAIAKATGSAA